MGVARQLQRVWPGSYRWCGRAATEGVAGQLQVVWLGNYRGRYMVHGVQDLATIEKSVCC